jgi:hypothetical protein
VARFLERGTMNRSTGETLMNDASSRSHAIFTISLEIYESQVCLFVLDIYFSSDLPPLPQIIERKEQEEGDEQPVLLPSDKPKKKKTEINSYIHSKLHLVDLAGTLLPPTSTSL